MVKHGGGRSGGVRKRKGEDSKIFSR